MPPPRCCPCLPGKGVCVRCRCVSAGRKCSNCWPSTEQQCKNQASRVSASMGTLEELLPAMQTAPHNEVFSTNKEPNPIERMVFNTSNSEDPIPSVDAAHDATQAPELEFDSIYDTIVHWRKKFFQVPWGSSGKLFTAELTRLLRSYVDTGGADHQALAAFFSFPALTTRAGTGKTVNTCYVD